MYFPLFLPLWGIRKGNKGNFMPKYVREVDSGKFSVFKHCSLLYQEVLRNPALLFLLSERKCSLWYWHRNVLTVPVHLSEQLHSRAGCWCRYVVTGESENLQILPAFLILTCKQCRVYSAVPDCHPVWGRQRIMVLETWSMLWETSKTISSEIISATLMPPAIHMLSWT